MIQNMRCEARSTEQNPSLEPSVSSETRRENVLFSIVLNHNPLGFGSMVNSYTSTALRRKNGRLS